MGSRLSHLRTSSWTRALAIGAVLSVALDPGLAAAQARDLASPRRESAASLTALPPSPGEGFVPVVLEADEARRLHVTERRRGNDAPVCRAPCARWLRPGTVRLGVGDEIGPRWWGEPIRLSQPTTIELHYVDNALTRSLGFVLLAASLVTIGASAYDLLDMGATDPPVAALVVAGLALGVSFGLFFVGDGVDVRVHPGIADVP